MLLQALVQLYENLKNDPQLQQQIPPIGYSIVEVTFAINLSSDGEILGIFPLGPQGQTLRSRPLIVPEYSEPTSNIQPSFLCGKSDYVLGISAKDADKPQHSQKRFQAFKEFHLGMLHAVRSAAAQAVVRFLEQHDPSSARDHPAIRPYIKDLEKGRRLVFQFQGKFVHEDPKIRKVWEHYYFDDKRGHQMQCLVTGTVSTVAIRHRKIAAKVGKKFVSSPLVSFNRRAFESYGRTNQQGLNAPVGRYAEAAYTRALNFLLSDQYPYEKPQIGDAITVYWAERENANYSALYAAILDPSAVATMNSIVNSSVLSIVENVLQRIAQGKRIDVDAVLSELAGNPKFYILGIAPVGEGRWQMRFFIENTFANLVRNILQHYKDASIVNSSQPLTIKRIAAACIPSSTTNEDARKRHYRNNAPIISATFQSMVWNTPYPVSLYHLLLRRIKAEKTISDVHAGMIKAFLLRKYRYRPTDPIQEVLTMSLNESSTHPAYVLGRLFAVLEKVQKEAIPNIKTTIKEKYFTSACATPASVFPILVRLAHHWISKAEYGYVAEQQIQELMALLEAQPFPRRLTLDEQGVFILGYYHQRAARRPEKEKSAADESAAA